ncbi:uncharacterized protein FFC1_15902 [Fusarium fujikuroi]|nr:uncharacterized protein FFC1_15902 [Fusarium fujikuroi]
MLASQY